MATLDDTGQQDAQDSSLEGAPRGVQALAQEEGRLTDLETSDPGHNGIVLAQEAEHEQMRLQEHEVPQGEGSTPPEGALEPDVPMSVPQDDQTPGSSSGELPEREVVPVPAQSQGAAGEEPLNEQTV